MGEREIAVRQKLLLFSLAGMVGFTIVIHFFHYAPIAFLIFITTFITVLLFIEVRTGFCILFGIFRLHNFKELGNLDCVEDKCCNRKDRIRAWSFIFFSMLLSIPYAWMVYIMTW